jgi:hypothetical protein
MTFSQIIARISEDRKKEDMTNSALAKSAFGESFPSHFTYRRGSESIVMTNPHGIAKRFLKLTAMQTGENGEKEDEYRGVQV